MPRPYKHRHGSSVAANHRKTAHTLKCPKSNHPVHPCKVHRPSVPIPMPAPSLIGTRLPWRNTRNCSESRENCHCERSAAISSGQRTLLQERDCRVRQRQTRNDKPLNSEQLQTPARLALPGAAGYDDRALQFDPPMVRNARPWREPAAGQPVDGRTIIPTPAHRRRGDFTKDF